VSTCRAKECCKINVVDFVVVIWLCLLFPVERNQVSSKRREREVWVSYSYLNRRDYGFIGLDWIGLDWIRQINVHIPIFSLNLSLSPSILFYRSFNGFSHPLPQSLLLLLLLLGILSFSLSSLHIHFFFLLSLLFCNLYHHIIIVFSIVKTLKFIIISTVSHVSLIIKL
jgi:hypothetical protein